ncbi:MAG: PP2C family serine/threonine-protein phosphatase [Bryobacteraceae bacterium]
MRDEDIRRALAYRLGRPGSAFTRREWESILHLPNWESNARQAAHEFGEMVKRGMVQLLQNPKAWADTPEERLVRDIFLNLDGASLERVLQALQTGMAAARATRVHFAATPDGGATFSPPPAPPAPQGGATFPVPPKSAPSAPTTTLAPTMPLEAEVATVPMIHDDSPLPSLFDHPEIPMHQEANAPPERAPESDIQGKAMWRYIEVADPDERHDDYDRRAFPAPQGFRLIGARVRGRKHKHEGSNCDDWLEAGSTGDWEVVAVADGAGSCRLSRVGAQVAAKTARDYLLAQLGNIQLDLPEDVGRALERLPDGAFKDETVDRLQRTLHLAIAEAAGAVKQRARDKEAPVKDLSSTLRLAIHHLLPKQRSSFLMACSVGDGMTAAVDTTGTLHLLGLEESGGAHSGETEFLTDDRSIAAGRLASETFVLVSPLRALMVMTDGIADPYFPNNPGMLRLYADLILNGIPDISVDPEALQDALLKSGREMPQLAKYSYTADTPVGPEERMQALIRQSDRFANELDMKLSDLLAWPPALLLAGAQGDPMNELSAKAPPEERLRIWLDSFYVRGEFDDRTLVVMQREAGR